MPKPTTLSPKQKPVRLLGRDLSRSLVGDPTTLTDAEGRDYFIVPSQRIVDVIVGHDGQPGAFITRTGGSLKTSLLLDIIKGPGDWFWNRSLEANWMTPALCRLDWCKSRPWERDPSKEFRFVVLD